MKGYFLGVDVGSVSTNAVLLDPQKQVVERVYLRTKGDPLAALRESLGRLAPYLTGADILGVGTTGSGRHLAALLLGADVVKNEITAHAVAAQWALPEVRTVIEIGGQDSKLIIIREGVVVDFAMNTVCAAGTGSFLDQQAARLGIGVEELGQLAVRSTSPVQIAGRCAVFAESDMIHKQQIGHAIPDILAGLCAALVRNYLNNLAKGKELLPPVVFQGGVAANVGIRAAFRAALGCEIHVPAEFGVMGAIGAALLAAEARPVYGRSRFRGLGWLAADIRTCGHQCRGCANLCEVVTLVEGGKTVAAWGDRCGRWAAETEMISPEDRKSPADLMGTG